MKKLFFSLVICYLSLQMTFAQIKLPVYYDSMYSTYYLQRLSLFDMMPVQKGDVVFIGNSITDGVEWSELFNDLHIKNRGISGDISSGILHRWQQIVAAKPKKVFLMIGTNDLARGARADSVVKNILLAADYLKQESSSTQLYIQSILPVTDFYQKFTGHTSKVAQILETNNKLKSAATAHQYTYIDLHAAFINADGKMNERYTNDGLHLVGEGYMLWKHLVFSYVYDLDEKPALIPLPQQVKWTNNCFPLYRTKDIVMSDSRLQKEALVLQTYLQTKGLPLHIVGKASSEQASIHLVLADHPTIINKEEGYTLTVTANKITITAPAPHGVFNGVQTLKQLMRDGVLVDGCEITDWPAFAMRGYMIDVGRNYLSIPYLKEQIDVMATSKMNVFHFHPTEDIAWRFEVKSFPQLTDAKHMLRNKGKYYTVEEIKELIAYCKERYITLIPEIDMPGHSAAFKRAMGFDMQSDSGKIVVKQILSEICDTYDVSYVHIGSDEVRIKDTSFVPEMTRLLEARGKKVMGWQPGGNFSSTTIRQLWREDANRSFIVEGVPYIDSRHLYLNHHDPEESIVTIFNRKIANRQQGDQFALGAILCLWHDRNVGREDDVLKMNPVYPGMLAFAERIWRGGGQAKWIANVSDGDAVAFAAFENRMMDHKQLYFTGKEFPYQRQANIQWDLYGPFSNEGNVDRVFDIEKWKNGYSIPKPSKQVVGGTIVMRHFWDPLIKGAVDEAKENTTWYASTKIWSDEAGEFPYWIGFYDLSRSPATNTAPSGKWDVNSSVVWVNGLIVPTPKWNRPGAKGDPEVPLIDEGYSYRPPTMIKLNKGWNKVLIKSPVGSFKSHDWQTPVKWMFTFLPVK